MYFILWTILYCFTGRDIYPICFRQQDNGKHLKWDHVMHGYSSAFIMLHPFKAGQSLNDFHYFHVTCPPMKRSTSHVWQHIHRSKTFNTTCSVRKLKCPVCPPFIFKFMWAVWIVSLFADSLNHPVLLTQRTAVVLLHPQGHAAVVERVVTFAPNH